MRGPRLSTLLIAFSFIMMVVAISLVGATGVALLRRLADEQAQARLTLAGLSAVEAIERTGARLAISARLLAERPTLSRILKTDGAAGLEEYLEAFRRTGQLEACAVVVGSRVLASSGSTVPWKEVAESGLAVQDSFSFYQDGSSPVQIVAQVDVPGLPDSQVVAARILDEAYARETGHKVGLQVEIHGRLALAESVDDARSALRHRAVTEEKPVEGRIDRPGMYLSAVPLRDQSGAVVGVVQTEMPVSVVDGPLRDLAGNLLALTFGIGILVTLFSFLLARRLTRPLERLTEVADRIGQGDLSSPVPPASGAEAGTLAAAMEDMRVQVLHLMTELGRREAEAKAILEGIVEGVFAVDRERRIQYLNPQAATLLGVSAEDSLGRFCGDVLNPQGGSGARPCENKCPILHARFRGSARAREELLLPGGRRRSVVITSSPSCQDTGGDAAERIHQLQVVRDETEVEATRRMRDAIFSSISHEFRSPLSAQLASLELLRDQLPELTPREIQELVLSLERGTLRLTRLIDNLLESTRVEAGQDALRSKEVALDDVVEEAVELMSPLIEQNRQSLEMDLPFPLPSVTGDAPRLTQVFVNLLANASKFAPGGTTIRIGGLVRDNEVELWVDDEGPGLPPGPPDALFERFVRSPGEEPEQSGMGLGLWVVKSIVERHGGRIETHSGNKGTRMSVILPREADDEDTRR